LVCIVIGGWLLYDFFNRSPRSWRRTCKYRLKPTQIDDGGLFFDHGGLVAFDDGNNRLIPQLDNKGSNAAQQILNSIIPIVKQQLPEFEQEVNVDVNKNFEIIDVPEIGFSGRIRVIEDFEHNLTVIRDFERLLCFIMPLDRQHVPGPKNLIETFLAMMSGAYLPDNELIRKTMKIKPPAVTDEELNAYGVVISSSCKGVKSYHLVKKTEEEGKRAARRRRDSKQNIQPYIFSVGKNAFAINID